MEDANINNDYLTLADAAEIAGCSTTTLRRAIRLGYLQATLFGKTYLVTREALDTWIKSDKHNPNMRRQRTK